MFYLFACMYVHHMCAWCPWMPGEGDRYPGTRVKDDCELLCGCWVPNLGPSARAASVLN